MPIRRAEEEVSMRFKGDAAPRACAQPGEDHAQPA